MVSISALSDNSLGQFQKSGVIKSVIICNDLENKQVSDVVSAWPSLPPNIKEAILLLVRQQFQ